MTHEDVVKVLQAKYQDRMQEAPSISRPLLSTQSQLFRIDPPIPVWVNPRERDDYFIQEGMYFISGIDVDDSDDNMSPFRIVGSSKKASLNESYFLDCWPSLTYEVVCFMEDILKELQ